MNCSGWPSASIRSAASATASSSAVSHGPSTLAKSPSTWPVHPVLMPRMADSEPHAPVIRRLPSMPVHAAQAVMAGSSATALDPDLAWGHEVQLVVEGGDIAGLQLEEGDGRLHRRRRCRSCRSAVSTPALSGRRPGPPPPNLLKRARQGLNPQRAAIRSTAMKPILCRCRAMPGSGLPSPTHSCTGPYFLAAGFAAGAFAGAAPLAGAALAAAAGAAAASAAAAHRRALVGAATVATTKSRSVIVAFTFLGAR